MNNAITNFTAASTLPSKIITTPDIISDACEEQIISPVHIQVNPTNKCPLNCSFCSLKHRNDSEIEYERLESATLDLISMGTKAVTITGGGDPLEYQKLGDYIKLCNGKGIKMGLVTNGVKFRNISDDDLSLITWCRVSLSSEYKLLTNQLKQKIKNNPRVDWAFSFVVTDKTDVGDIIEAVKFANKNNFTHVRLVEEIINGSSVSMKWIKEELEADCVDDTKVIYQSRKKFSKGSKKCLISLLKPNIDADGNIYACCGIQYASGKNPDLSFNPKYSMGSIEDIKKIWGKQKYFDGSLCEKCFYSEYNDILNMLWDSNKIKHKEFV